MDLMFSPDKLLADICRKSFYDFLLNFWNEISTMPLVDNWHIKYLCNELQVVAEAVFRGEKKKNDVICNIPPGTSKSSIVSILYPAWIWTFFPKAKILGCSYTDTVALEMSRKNRDIIYSNKYQKLFDVKLRIDQNAKGNFINDKGGVRYSTGVTGSLTSMHFDFLLVDDPLSPKQAASPAELATANNFLSETLPTRKTNKECSVLVLIMQRLSENDSTGFLISQRKSSIVKDLKHIVLPAEESDLINPPELRKYYVNGLLDPIRLNHNVLEIMKRDLGISYSGQFEQFPVSRINGFFRPEQLIRVKTLPGPLIRSVRAWDKAGSDSKNCYTAGVKMGLLRDGSFIIMDMIRFQAEPFRRNEIMRQTAELDGRGTEIVIETEPGSAGIESSQSSIRQLAGFKVKCDRPSGSKEVRADPLASMINSGNMFLLEGDYNIDLINELLYFPSGKYKDQVDACSMAFSTLTGKRTIDYKQLMNAGGNLKIPLKINKSNITVGGLILPK